MTKPKRKKRDPLASLKRKHNGEWTWRKASNQVSVFGSGDYHVCVRKKVMPNVYEFKLMAVVWSKEFARAIAKLGGAK